VQDSMYERQEQDRDGLEIKTTLREFGVELYSTGQGEMLEMWVIRCYFGSVFEGGWR